MDHATGPFRRQQGSARMTSRPEGAPMTTASPSVQTPGLFSRENIVAGANFNRWLVPPAALCIHLCIGMAYGFSVFWLPLSRAIGIDEAVACPGLTLLGEIFTTRCD